LTRIDDPEFVREHYSSERGLEGRRAAYRHAQGPDPRELAYRAVAEARPHRVLEVGCGPGELAARIKDELEAEVVAVDVSPRMVDLAVERGVDARQGDVQDLPFGTGEFDCAVAAWMLYHVPDLERGLSELRRVVRPGGRLVAVTNGVEHMGELAELLHVQPMMRSASFRCDNAPELLGRHFDRVERRHAGGWVVFPAREEAQAYVDSTAVLSGPGRELPPFEGPIRVRRSACVLVAE
jgi:SAM-dependent methyltransferase